MPTRQAQPADITQLLLKTGSKAAMEAALGQQLAGIVSAAAGKLAGDASEDYIKDFWFEYARDLETQPNLNPLSHPQDGGYVYYP